jgi:hypothetical protein
MTGCIVCSILSYNLIQCYRNEGKSLHSNTLSFNIFLGFNENNILLIMSLTCNLNSFRTSFNQPEIYFMLRGIQDMDII